RRPARGGDRQRRHGGGPSRLPRPVRRVRDAPDAGARPRPGRAGARHDPEGAPRRVPRDQRERARALRPRVRADLRALRRAGAPGAAPPDSGRGRRAPQALLPAEPPRQPVRHGDRGCAPPFRRRPRSPREAAGVPPPHGLRAPARDHHEARAAVEGGPGARPRGQRPPAPPALVSAEFWITQAFNGISYGALLFLLASGLSLIFGVMRIVNLAHGSYFML